MRIVHRSNGTGSPPIFELSGNGDNNEFHNYSVIFSTEPSISGNNVKLENKHGNSNGFAVQYCDTLP